MIVVLVAMSIVMVVAVAALAFAAFPHRGRAVPGAPWLDDLVQRATDAVPLVGDDEPSRR